MNNLSNMPEVKLGVVGVSRDCFPISLTTRRLDNLESKLTAGGINVTRCQTVIESEASALKALDELNSQGVNAVVIYLGNFGPEGPTTIFAGKFAGPVMFCAAAEENRETLSSNRGDALCGMLNMSYNLKLRKIKAYIPENPVGAPAELVKSIAAFIPVARTILGLAKLKVMSFGPRPQDFYACNAPIAPLYDLGIEVMENSELDLLQEYRKNDSAQIAGIIAEMESELGHKGNTYPDLLPRLAQFEYTLTKFAEKNLGCSEYMVFANKCWPSFEEAFGFVPCYINSRLAARGIPVACEVDIYGAVSEYMVQCASDMPATILDINNSVPNDILPGDLSLPACVAVADLFMAFHCGNTASSCMKDCKIKYQLIMNRLIEQGNTPDITRGTLEGQLKPGDTTLFRLQSSADCKLKSYVAEGSILDISPCSFGSIGIFAIPEFRRFYRHILIGGGFPHHCATGFAKVGGILFNVLQYMGITDVSTPQGNETRYPAEVPFCM